MNDPLHGSAKRTTPRPRRGGIVLAAMGLVAWAGFAPAASTGDDAPAASAAAADPVRGPGLSPADGRRDDGEPGFRRGGRPTTQGANPARPAGGNVSWDEVAAFMGENSPRKWATFRNIPSRESRGFADSIANRYATLKRLQRSAPDEYALEVARVRLEDGIFGAMVDYHKATTPAQKRAAEKDMNGRVGELLDGLQKLGKVRLENRQKRLAALEKQEAALRSEIASLSAEVSQYETADRDEMVKSQAERFLKKQGFGGPRPGARPRGPDGDGWREGGKDSKDSADRRGGPVKRD